MNALWGAAKSVARMTWFRQGTVRRCFLGPYSGLKFELCPQLLESRMCVFYRGYEPEVASFLSQVVHPGSVVLVAGAHVGIHVLHVAKLLRSQGAIYAFEAWPDNFRVLERNVRCNSSRRMSARAIHMALCDRTGMTNITEGSTDGTHHLTRNGEPATHRVPCTTLDRFCSENECRPDLILIDVEGAELDVLRGAQEIVVRYRPTFLIEHHGNSEMLVSWFRDKKYDIHAVGNRHLHANHEVARVDGYGCKEQPLSQ